MANLAFTHILGSSVTTPSAGTSEIYFDSIDKQMRRIDDTGFVTSYIENHSTVAQVIAAATRTYIAGTNFKASSRKVQIGSKFRWTFNLSKTSAAGIATSTFDIAVGTLGTTGDTARVSFTKPVGTAAVDEGKVEIECIVRGPITLLGVLVGEFTMTHNGNTVGHMTIPVANVNTVSGTFDLTVANLQFGVCITTGAADTITIQQVLSEAWDI